MRAAGNVATEESEIPALQFFTTAALRTESWSLHAVLRGCKNEPMPPGSGAPRPAAIVDYSEVAEKAARTAMRRDPDGDASRGRPPHTDGCPSRRPGKSSAAGNLIGCAGLHWIGWRGSLADAHRARRRTTAGPRASSSSRARSPSSMRASLPASTTAGRGREGPNAVLAPVAVRRGEPPDLAEVPPISAWRLVARYWRTGLGEIYRSREEALVAAPALVPRSSPGPPPLAGGQKSPRWKLVDDFVIIATRALHVATRPPRRHCVLAIGEEIAALARRRFELRPATARA